MGPLQAALGACCRCQPTCHSNKPPTPDPPLCFARRPLLQRLASALYVADFVTQFSKQLGVRVLHYENFEHVLAGE